MWQQGAVAEWRWWLPSHLTHGSSESVSTSKEGQHPSAPAPCGISLSSASPNSAQAQVAPQRPQPPLTCSARAAARPLAPGARDARPSSAREQAGLGLGGAVAVPPAAPLMSSRLFPSLLCTRHAPCEPFLRGIRTKGSWEYLSGTGESRNGAGGTLLPSYRAPPPWHRRGYHCCGHGCCRHRCRGYHHHGVTDMRLLPWHRCRGISIMGVATVAVAMMGFTTVASLP